MTCLLYNTIEAVHALKSQSQVKNLFDKGEYNQFGKLFYILSCASAVRRLTVVCSH